MQEMEQDRLGPDHTAYHLAMDAAGRGSGEGIWTCDLPWFAILKHCETPLFSDLNQLILDLHGLKMSIQDDVSSSWQNVATYCFEQIAMILLGLDDLWATFGVSSRWGW